MSIHLHEVIHDIIEDLKRKPCPENSSINVWTAIIAQIAERDSFDGSYCNIIQSLIKSSVAKLDDDDKISIWKETETGLNSDIEAQYFPIDQISLDLEEELLDAITHYAWNEAEEENHNKG